MNSSSPCFSAFVATALVAAASSSLAATVPVDVEAAKAVFKENDCRKCHDPVKTKGGPSLKKIAEK